jgi:ADP-ribose pyrophosphatase
MTDKIDNISETLITSKNIFNGDFLRVMSDTVQLPDKEFATREWIKFGRASAIIVITDDDEIILERQYRHPVGQIMLEIPAGKTEIDESPLASAKRELLEETGYSAKIWIELGTCFPCIGYSNEAITYFLAKDLSLGNASLDAGEFLEVFKLPFSKCMEMAYTNQITDSKTLSGLMLYQGYLDKTKT